jgi:hypothetical protein
VTWENRLIFEVSSAPPDADFPVWVDLTSRIRDNIRPVDLRIGRQNDLEQAEPSRLEIMLDNADDALTFGNTTSPYASWWGPGCRCRLREPHAGAVFELFDGFVEVPQEALITAGIEQRIALTAVDRLGRLENAPEFISTLAAHIMGSGPAAYLAGYWPLADGSLRPAVGPVTAVLAPTVVVYGQGQRVTDLWATAATGPPGDDVDGISFAPDLNGLGAEAHLVAPVAIPVTSAQTLTIAAWIKPSPGVTAAGFPFLLNCFHGSQSSSFDIDDLNTGTTEASFHGAFGTAAFPGPFPLDVWRLTTASINLATGALSLWSGTDLVATNTVAGSPLTGDTFTDLLLGNALWEGSIAHVQIYVGADTAFRYVDHLAQVQVGMLGLERQTTGDRIRTIAQYAGLPNVETVNTVDKGQSVMQVARLAGKTPLDAMREAETTEQGLLHTDGAGHLVFKDRRTLYNV